MPENYRIKVNNGSEVNVRLVGLITEKECEAVMNTEDGVKKVITAENIDLTNTALPSPFGLRFVLVVRDYQVKLGSESDTELADLRKDKINPKLFMSAIVERMSYVTKNKVLHTKDKNKYQFIPITTTGGASA